jgi:hypothetical protein
VFSGRVVGFGIFLLRALDEVRVAAARDLGGEESRSVSPPAHIFNSAA